MTVSIASEIPLDQLISSLNLLVSGVAAFVSLLILWFTVAKGPDIGLVTSLAFSIREPYNSTSYSIDSIELNQVEMVFVNSGSKSGAIVEVKAVLTPSRPFGRFFEDLSSVVVVESPSRNEASTLLPMIIPERGTAVATLGLSIKLKPWKNLSRIADLRNVPLGAALNQIWKDGEESLGAFSQLKGNIGSLEIRVIRTKRRHLRIQVREDVVVTGLRVGELPEWVRSMAEQALGNFPQLSPSDAQVAREIRIMPEFFNSDFNQNLPALSTSVREAGAKTVSTAGRDQALTWERWNQIPYQILAHETALAKKIAEYYQQATLYNEKVLAVSAGYAWDTPEASAIDAMRADLLEKTKDLREDLLKLRAKLAQETAHMISGQ